MKKKEQAASNFNALITPEDILNKPFKIFECQNVLFLLRFIKWLLLHNLLFLLNFYLTKRTGLGQLNSFENHNNLKFRVCLTLKIRTRYVMCVNRYLNNTMALKY